MDPHSLRVGPASFVKRHLEIPFIEKWEVVTSEQVVFMCFFSASVWISRRKILRSNGTWNKRCRLGGQTDVDSDEESDSQCIGVFAKDAALLAS